jgi:SpoVK/Ycf46/Vps4 family AAA+-type ATPase
MVDGASRYEKAAKLNSGDFKQLFGVKKETFDAMVEILKLLTRQNTNNVADTLN